MEITITELRTTTRDALRLIREDKNINAAAEALSELLHNRTHDYISQTLSDEIENATVAAFKKQTDRAITHLLNIAIAIA